jgi:chromosome segregation ATPase
VVDQGEVGSRRGRLAEIERRIDRAAERSTAARDDTRARVEPRLRSLRDPANRGRSLDALEADVSVVEAQLDLDDAVGSDAFVRAARRTLRAYRSRLDALRTEVGASAALPAETGTAEGLIALATERLDRFERATPSGTTRTRVLVALDELDRSCRAAVDAEREGG